MTSNNEAANALMKLKTSKKAKRGPKPKPRPNSSLSARELNNKYKVETANKSNSMNKITTALIANRSNKPKNNNNRYRSPLAYLPFLQSIVTPRKNTNKK